MLEKAILKEPPILKGFFTREIVKKAREEGRLLTSNVYFYPECLNGCIFCAYADNRDKKMYVDEKGIKRSRIKMSLENYDRLFCDISKLGVKTLFVPGMGEPLLRKKGWDFVEYIESANKYGLDVVVISSLNPEPSDTLVEKLKKLDVSIIAKLESMIPEQFNFIVRPKIPYNFVEIKDYGHVTRGIKKLMDAGFNIPDKKGEVRLGSGTVVNNYNKDEAEKIFRFYRDFNIWPYMQTVSPFERALTYPGLYNGLDKFEVFRSLLKIDEEEYGYTWSEYERRVGFDFVYPTFIVEFGGEIRFNAFFRYMLGHVLEDDSSYREGRIEEIANSKVSRWLRKIYFPIGGAEGCYSEDHSKCKKVILNPEEKIQEEHLGMNPDDFCIFSRICTRDMYLKVK